MPEMLFGAHMSIAGGMHKAILRGRKATCDTIQIFDKSNNQWRAAPLRRDDLDRYFELIETTGITVATAHSSYLINIASPDPVLFERSLASLLEEMDRCQILRIPNLVLHPGSHVGSGEITGLRRVAEAINTMFDRLSPPTRLRCCLRRHRVRVPILGTGSSIWQRSSVWWRMPNEWAFASIPVMSSRPDMPSRPSRSTAVP
jgi:endonuclease IV